MQFLEQLKLGNIMSKILALIEAVKALGKIVDLFKQLYNKWLVSSQEKKAQKKKDQISKVTRQIQHETEKENPSDDKLRNLHRRLSDISNKL